jgi:D-alanyl-D-alanine carboxypeptidase
MRYFVSILLVLAAVLTPLTVFAAPAEEADSWPGIEHVEAAAYIVLNADTGEILVEHNIDELRSMASTTKLITAMVVMDDPAYDPERMCTASEAGIYFQSEEAVRVGLLPGEEISTIELLRASMIISANDAANTLAENYSGVEGSFEYRRDVFVEKMNEYVRNIGANNTNFTNAIGFDHEDHYTTARDLAIIGAYALRNPDLIELTSLGVGILGPTNMHPEGDWAFMINSNRLVLYGPKLFRSRYFSEYNGLKSGTTPWAGKCLVASGKFLDGTNVVGVILDGTLWMDGRDVNMATLMRAVLEEGGRVHVERHGPLVPATAETTPAPTVTETTPETTPPAPLETELVPEPLPEPTVPLPPGDKEGGRVSILTYVFAGTTVVLFIIAFVLMMEMRRVQKRKKQLRAMRALREMQQYGESGRKTPYR